MTIAIQNSRAEKLRLSLETQLKTDGGTPSHFLDLLAEAVELEIWNELDDVAGFSELIELPPPRGLGSDREQIKTILKLKHRSEATRNDIKRRMEGMRRKVNELLTPERYHHGGDRKSDKISSNGPLLDISNLSSDGIKARLKRDNPSLARQVFNNELTPHAAGIQAGFIKKRAKFIIGDVDQTARQIRKYFSPDEIAELIELLNQ